MAVCEQRQTPDVHGVAGILWSPCYLFVQTVTVPVRLGGETLLFRLKLSPWYQTCCFFLWLGWAASWPLTSQHFSPVTGAPVPLSHACFHNKQQIYPHGGAAAGLQGSGSGFIWTRINMQIKKSSDSINKTDRLRKPKGKVTLWGRRHLNPRATLMLKAKCGTKQ